MTDLSEVLVGMVRTRFVPGVSQPSDGALPNSGTAR